MRRRILRYLFLAPPLALPLVALLLVPTLEAAPEPKPVRSLQMDEMEEAGTDMGQAVFTAEDCSACHDDRVEVFSGNPHAVLDQPGWSAHGGSCVSCHRGAADHIEQGGGEGTIFAFAETEPVLTRTSVCQECHGDAHPQFQATKHAAAGMTCTSCHTIHGSEDPEQVAALDLPPDLLRPASVAGGWHGGPFDEIDGASATCAECHTSVVSEFQQAEHHRLEEGVMTCSSCHDPHEPQARLALGGFEMAGCSDCHADKAGPFVFEHGALQVEGCTACHTPHGSTNRHMLTFQNQGELCYSCHSLVPGFHVGSADNLRFGLDANCTNCHSSIHGSNFDPYFLK